MEFALNPLTFACVPVVVGLVSALKKAGLKTAWAPVVSIVFGLGAAFLFETELSLRILGGVIVGLTSSGLYSGVKATIN